MMRTELEILRQIIEALPSNKDWLDPQLEAEAREAIKTYNIYFPKKTRLIDSYGNIVELEGKYKNVRIQTFLGFSTLLMEQNLQFDNVRTLFYSKEA